MFKSPYFDKLERNLRKNKSTFRNKHLEIRGNCYPKELARIVEKHIHVYGHACCMDVPSERRKISKLLINLLNELSQ